MIVDQKLNRGFAGVYLIDGDIDGTKLATSVKPNWFRRVMTKLFIGWEWITIKELKRRQTEIEELKKETDKEINS